MATRTIGDIDVAGKTVLMRVDFNVPLKNGVITDDNRIVQALPSIRKALDQGAKLVLMTHFGRPAGIGFEPAYSVKPIAARLSELIGREVLVGPESVVGPETAEMVGRLKAGDVLLLENVRFCAGETMPDNAKANPDGKLTPEQQQILDDFVLALGSLGDVYVNDAFGTCHRKHASMFGAAKVIQKKGGAAVAGYLVEKEIRYLHEAVDNPKRPFVAVMGGAKVSDKIKLISTLLGKVDRLLIGGAMAYTLLKARGVEVGRSLVEEDQVNEMKGLLEKAGDKILLPVDHVATDDFAAGSPKVVTGVDIPAELLGMDIGPATIRLYGDELRNAGTIVWNGPMGVFEKPDYAAGTRAVAEAAADATARGAISVIGGGDSAAAVAQMGLDDRMTHISTGGGASLKYLEGKAMPPIEVLDRD
ncbi:MAG TPA: phosphoglycerate kinase [Myxococcota bacterium]|nr:phosphoglycerate kinase [Myxococcota bacterium]HOA13288.1 phosphoglycerate kinase [Myxococcota bacterium]HOC99586.1 phosphoglycerate kinase [Myxococcota bacterium]HOH76864.1 phosphoglycerate kinase [Myxococcota bacterium]HPV03740.1 phosphoglycerate kinase [Myxococcota bacterium]